MNEGDEGFVFLRPQERTDAGDGDSGDAARDACYGGRGEEELVVFASVDRGIEGLFAGESVGELVEGQRARVDLGAHSGGFAEVGEVGGEAVADVDGSGCEVSAEQRR